MHLSALSLRRVVNVSAALLALPVAIVILAVVFPQTAAAQLNRIAPAQIVCALNTLLAGSATGGVCTNSPTISGTFKAATINATAGYQVNGTAGVGFAASTAQPADQTGNATATLKMNGLGAAAAPCTITPTATGRVVFTITGDLTNSTILDGISYKLVFGTGTAPANSAAASGTAISALRGPAVPVAAQNQGFSIEGLTTGLALNVAVWFDVQIANLTGGTASISNVTCTAKEI